MTIAYDVVIPTIDRPCLQALITALGRQHHRPGEIHVIHDDERRGPAVARNQGWRASTAPWVVFLDDDVVPSDDWSQALQADLVTGPRVGAVTARIVVPELPARPTDDELATIALEEAACVTADLAVRRTALEAIGGFDERLPHAFREDTDLALRLMQAGWCIGQGTRLTEHPLRHGDPWWSSVRRQRGNADDAFMRRRHGGAWRLRAGVPRGALPLHLVATAGIALTAAGALARRPGIALIGAGLWAGSTGAFLAHRLQRGSHDPAEVASLVVTSVVIPPVAVGARAVGEWRHRHVRQVNDAEAA